MKTKLIIAGAMALALTGTMAQAQQRPERGLRGDANGDGAITEAEARAQAKTMFTRMDANGDGRINADDRKAQMEKRFAKLDTNSDGEVSQVEMAAARAERQQRRFERLDADKSGGLSKAEMAAMRPNPPAMHGMHGMHGMQGKQGGERWEQRRGGGMAMMRRADSNGDQSISKAEFEAAALQRFQKADANSDGTVTAEERQAMRESMRQAWRAAPRN